MAHARSLLRRNDRIVNLLVLPLPALLDPLSLNSIEEALENWQRLRDCQHERCSLQDHAAGGVWRFDQIDQPTASSEPTEPAMVSMVPASSATPLASSQPPAMPSRWRTIEEITEAFIAFRG